MVASARSAPVLRQHLSVLMASASRRSGSVTMTTTAETTATNVAATIHRVATDSLRVVTSAASTRRPYVLGPVNHLEY